MQCNSSCVAPTAGSRMRGIALNTPTKAVSIRHAPHPTVRVLRQDSRRANGVACRASLDPETVTNATYLGLGLGAASFVGTFFVAPKFKDSFKEDMDWREIYQSLAATGVKQVDAAEAYAKCKSGSAILLDVRLGNKYEASHAAGSLSTPLYLPIQEWDLASVIRRAGFAFFGIYGTELNTNFAAEVQQRVPKGKQIIVVCETGGSIENKSGTKFGFQSRSLKAIFYLQRAGLNQVSYVKGGLNSWAREGYPMAEGPEDLAAVAALQAGNRSNDDDDSSGQGIKLLGGLRLPQFSFGPARR